MLEFVFDLPLVLSGPVLIGALCLFAVGGEILVRRRVLTRLRVGVADSEFTGAMLQSVMVFYGLAVALMAVSVSQTYSDVTKIVSGEATCLAALYRDVSTYPEPVRPQLQGELRAYVDDVIEKAWPLQREGKIPTGGVGLLNKFQTTLAAFEPATEGQKLIHGETLRAYNQMIQARRLRLDAVNSGMPSVMWTVIVAGAFICLTSSFFFKVEDVRLHTTMVLLLAAFIGLVIFMIVALDRPFRGDLGVSSESYQLIRGQLMERSP